MKALNALRCSGLPPWRWIYLWVKSAFVFRLLSPVLQWCLYRPAHRLWSQTHQSRWVQSHPDTRPRLSMCFYIKLGDLLSHWRGLIIANHFKAKRANRTVGCHDNTIVRIRIRDLHTYIDNRLELWHMSSRLCRYPIHWIELLSICASDTGSDELVDYQNKGERRITVRGSVGPSSVSQTVQGCVYNVTYYTHLGLLDDTTVTFIVKAGYI